MLITSWYKHWAGVNTEIWDMTTWPHDHMVHQSPDISLQMINNAEACKEIICQNYKSLKIAFQAGCINKFMSTLYFNTQSVHCWGYLWGSVFTLIMSVLVEHPEISSRYSPIHHWEMFELIQTKTPPTLMVMITTYFQHPTPITLEQKLSICIKEISLIK